MVCWSFWPKHSINQRIRSSTFRNTRTFCSATSMSEVTARWRRSKIQKFQLLRLDLYAKSKDFMIFCQRGFLLSLLCQFSWRAGWSSGPNFLCGSIKTYLLCTKIRTSVFDSYFMFSQLIFVLRLAQIHRFWRFWFRFLLSLLCQFSRSGGWSSEPNFLCGPIKTYLLCTKIVGKSLDDFEYNFSTLLKFLSSNFQHTWNGVGRILIQKFWDVEFRYRKSENIVLTFLVHSKYIFVGPYEFSDL